MSKINRHPVRRTAAGVLAGALALSGAVAVATPAAAGPNFALERIAGENRYQTSARIATAFGSTTGAILASGETGRSVDALSANFLAGVRQEPVLLTQRDRVPAEVMARLNALTGAKNVTIVGGTVAVSAAVETRLRGMGFNVTRLGGADRFETSEAIITAGRASANPIGLVASGTNFPDALAGGPLAYKGKHPIFLTSGGGLPQDTIDAMVAAGTRQVIILGGTAAVPASVETALAARNITVVTRLGGAGRSETSRIIADYLIANQGFTNTTFNVASGAPRLEGVDALSGGALSGKQNRALLITDTQTQAAPVVDFARARAATLNAVGNIFGGPAAVAVALEEAIEAAGRGTGVVAGATATARPELTSAQIVSTTPANLATVANPAGTVVRYTFDERVASIGALNLFNVYNFNAPNTPINPDSVTLDTADATGRSVLARFNALVSTAANATGTTADISVATVAAGAVTDTQGLQSPTGDAALGTGQQSGATLTAGRTTAPDLVSIGGFRATANANVTAVDFTFDQNAFVQSTTGFELVLTNGRTATGTGPTVGSTNTTEPGGGTTAGGNGTTTITVLFTDPPLVPAAGTTPEQPFVELSTTTGQAPVAIARGTVFSGTVGSLATGTGAVTGGGTDAGVTGAPTAGGQQLNPLQSADTPRANTTGPDLVSVTINRGTAGTANPDVAVFTFDQAVNSTTGAGTLFRVYTNTGQELQGGTGGATPVPVVGPGATNNQVAVSFANGALANAVGGNVLDAAVTATATGTPNNQQDEVAAAAVSQPNQTTQPAGRTTGPDLTSVTLRTTGTFNQFAATYTFDEQVTVATAGAAAGGLNLYLADGTRLLCDATAATVGTTATTNNQVTCTSFTVFGGSTAATNAQVGAAVAGTAVRAAVVDLTGNNNVEGYEVTTGGTGTPNTGTPVAAAPTVTSVSPATGGTAGGTVVTITGTNFTGATGVTFGGVAGTSFTVNPGGTSITVTAPAGTAGAQNVVVQSPNGNVTQTGGFTFTA